MPACKTLDVICTALSEILGGKIQVAFTEGVGRANGCVLGSLDAHNILYTPPNIEELIVMAFFSQLEFPYSLSKLTVFFDSPHSYVEGITDEDASLWYEEVATVIVTQFGREGVELLLKKIHSVDDIRLRAILASLSRVSHEVLQEVDDAIIKILSHYLHDKRPNILMEAVIGLSKIGYTKAKNDIVPLLKHSSSHVVFSALHYLSKHFPNIARPAILEALRSSDTVVKQAAIDEAEDLQFAEALPFIRQLLTDEDKDVRQAAKTAVENLSEAESVQ